MKKIITLFLTALILAVTLSACGTASPTFESKDTTTDTKKTETTSAIENNLKPADDDKKDAEGITEQQSLAQIAEDYYLSYVLGKMVVDGKEMVYLTDERDMDNWQVPVKDAVVGEGNDYARIRFISIDWKTDGTIEQVNMCDFLAANTYGALVNPGSSGKLSVNSYGAEAGGVPDHSEWDMAVNGTEVRLTGENGTVYYFYEDRFDGN